jgi:gas vesicle protein
MTKIPRTLYGAGIGVIIGAVAGTVLTFILNRPMDYFFIGMVIGAWLCIGTTWLLETYWPEKPENTENEFL